MDLIVGMGEYVVTDNKDAIIKTHALGSCVAVTAYSPLKKVAGMIHVVLPSPLNDRDWIRRPCFFAKSGIPLLIDVMYRQFGCRKEELQVQIYGGAESVQNMDIYNIGKKNIEAVKRTLSDLGLIIQRTDLSGYDSRSLSMEVQSGTVLVHRQPIVRRIV